MPITVKCLGQRLVGFAGLSESNSNFVRTKQQKIETGIS